MIKQLPQKFGTLFLTLILITGIIIPSCEVDEMEEQCDPALTNGCGCPPTEYFDVQGMNLYVWGRKGEAIAELDTVFLENELRIWVDFEVDYHASSSPYLKNAPFFSTMSSSYACDVSWRPLGSKTEVITRFDVITLNDFDEEHKANESINDLLTFSPETPWQEEALLPEYLATNTENVLETYMRLLLHKAPTLDPEFHIKAVIELSTGEIYEAERAPFILLP